MIIIIIIIPIIIATHYRCSLPLSLHWHADSIKCACAAYVGGRVDVDADVEAELCFEQLLVDEVWRLEATVHNVVRHDGVRCGRTVDQHAANGHRRCVEGGIGWSEHSYQS